MKKYKAILFDYDGTLIGTNMLVYKSWQHTAVTTLGRELPDEEILSTYGIPLEQVMDAFAEKYHIPQGGAYCTKVYRDYQFSHIDEADSMKPFDGIPEMLAELKNRGALLGIVTSRANFSLEIGLERFGLRQYFDAIIGAEDTSIHKPDPEPAILCCRKLGVNPDEALMVGDSVFDLQCGHNAGTDACFVNWSFCTSIEKAIAEAHPEYMADNAMQIADFV